MIGKILRSLPRAWETKVMTIKKAKNLKTLNFDEFIGSLIAYEGKIKELKVNSSNIKKKSLTLKAINKDEDRNGYNGEEDEDLAVVTRNFTKYLRIKKYGTNHRNFRKKKGDNRESRSQDAIFCYECKKSSHMKYYCPNVKKISKCDKKKRAIKSLLMMTMMIIPLLQVMMMIQNWRN
jgi:hypothetical protein